jgi:hypothetical protein
MAGKSENFYFIEPNKKRKLTDVLLTIFTAHEENKVVEAREFREVYLHIKECQGRTTMCHLQN